MRRMGGGASFCDPGFGRARNEKPPDGVPGVGFGEAGGMDGSGSGGRERRGIRHPPREIPPRGVRKGGCGVSGLLLRIPGDFLPLRRKLLALRTCEVWHHRMMITGTTRSIHKLMAHSQYVIQTLLGFINKP